MNQPLWNLEAVSLRGTDRPRLDKVTCEIRAGVTAILGESGAGKSSLLNLLAGLEQPDSGTVRLGLPPTDERLPIYWAPQGGGLWPHLTATQHLTAVGKDGESADKLLSQFGLNHRRSAMPGEMSQGEQARLAIARALAVSAQVLLFDEPLVHVDGEHKRSGWQIIRDQIQATETHLVLTTHEPDIVLREAEFVICLSGGRVAWEGSVDALYHHPPTVDSGQFLGPLNWLNADVRGRWLPETTSECLRPERLEILPEVPAVAVATVERSEFMGSHARTTLRHKQHDELHTFVHRPSVPLATETPVVIHERHPAGVVHD